MNELTYGIMLRKSRGRIVTKSAGCILENINSIKFFDALLHEKIGCGARI